MSLGLALNNALSGIRLNQLAINVASTNIANVNTEGYSKKILPQETNVLNGKIAGVKSGNLRRNVDKGLLLELRNQRTILGGLSARQNILSRTEDFFGAPGSNAAINTTVNKMGDAFNALSINPDDSVAQADFINQAIRTTTQLRGTTSDIQELRFQADQKITEDITKINDILKRVDSLNSQIERENILKQSTAAFEDQRDNLLGDLSELINFTTFNGKNGRVAVVMSGNLLVDTTAKQLSYTPVSAVGPSTVFSPIFMDGIDITAQFSKGEVADLIKVRDTDLPNMAAQLDELSSKIYEEVNAANNLGTPFPPPNVLTGASTFAAGAATPFTGTGTVRIALTDANGDILDNAGTPRILDLDLSTVANIGDVINAINTDANLSGQVTASLGANNELIITGTGNNRIGITETTAVNITTPASTRGFSHFFGLNNIFTADETATNPGEFSVSMNVNAALVADPNRIATATMTQAAIANIQVGANVVGIGDGSNAQRLADSLNNQFSFNAAGGLNAMTRSISDYAAAIISFSANQIAQTQTDLDIQENIVSNLQTKEASLSGVNIDEELSEIILFENAFNASAQVVSTVNKMLDQLENMLN